MVGQRHFNRRGSRFDSLCRIPGFICLHPAISNKLLSGWCAANLYQKNVYNQNLPVKEDVYFREHMINALYDYTLPTGWDSAINTYLREGESFFNSKKFLDNLNVYGNPNFKKQKAMIENAAKPGNENLAIDIIGTDECEELIIKNKLKVSNPPTKNQIAYILPSLIYYIQEKSIQFGINNIKEHIEKIDKCFVDAAPRVTTKMEKIKYFRGMTCQYDFSKSNEIILKNFTSISPEIRIAKQFGIHKQKKPDKNNYVCCLYQFYLTQGVPYINMINNTKYKHEREILLPRDVKLTLFKTDKVFYKTINKKQIYYNHFHVRVTLQNEQQFKTENKCITFDTASIKSVKLKKILTSITPPEKIPGVLQMKPNNIDKELSKKVAQQEKSSSSHKVSGEEKQEEDEDTDSETKVEEPPIDLAICKGLTEEECDKLKHCTYSKGAKRQFCRNKHKTKKNKSPQSKKSEPAKSKKSKPDKSPTLKKSLKCKGLSEEDCNKLDECIFSKGAKRQFCRTKKNK